MRVFERSLTWCADGLVGMPEEALGTGPLRVWHAGHVGSLRAGHVRTEFDIAGYGLVGLVALVEGAQEGPRSGHKLNLTKVGLSQ